MNKWFFFITIILLGCSKSETKNDAFGNFEAVEVTISAEQQGKILQLDLDEGDMITAGDTIGLIDTTMLHLQKEQLEVRKKVVSAKFPNVSAELAVLEEQKATINTEIGRFTTLAEQGAAPTKQVDDLKDQLRVLEKRIDAVRTQNRPLTEELDMIDVQIRQINEQINDALIITPITGTVLIKQAEPGEMTRAGAPLFRIANLEELILRAYLTGDLLDDIRIGQKVTVLTDKNADEYDRHKGTITWIASEAEFTPKSIQTKDERADLVYAVKIRVTNDGSLKIGMPAEVVLDQKILPEGDQRK